MGFHVHRPRKNPPFYLNVSLLQPYVVFLRTNMSKLYSVMFISLYILNCLLHTKNIDPVQVNDGDLLFCWPSSLYFQILLVETNAVQHTEPVTCCSRYLWFSKNCSRPNTNMVCTRFTVPKWMFGTKITNLILSPLELFLFLLHGQVTWGRNLTMKQTDTDMLFCHLYISTNIGYGVVGWCKRWQVPSNWLIWRLWLRSNFTLFTFITGRFKVWHICLWSKIFLDVYFLSLFQWTVPWYNYFWRCLNGVSITLFNSSCFLKLLFPYVS